MQAKKILKRSLLSLAFLTAFGFASIGTSSDAEAGCYRRGYSGYGGYGRTYHSYHRGGFTALVCTTITIHLITRLTEVVASTTAVVEV